MIRDEITKAESKNTDPTKAKLLATASNIVTLSENLAEDNLLVQNYVTKAYKTALAKCEKPLNDLNIDELALLNEMISGALSKSYL